MINEQSCEKLAETLKIAISSKITDKYYTCIHRVVSCGFHTNEGQLDPNDIVKCQPAYTTSAAGFGEIKCPDGDLTQTSFAVKSIDGTREAKIIVNQNMYDKFAVGDYVNIRCNKKECDNNLTFSTIYGKIK